MAAAQQKPGKRLGGMADALAIAADLRFPALNIPLKCYDSGVLKAVENVHAMIDREAADGIHPENIYVCGFSQGGALTLAIVLLYPKMLGGGAIFSGWVPFGSSVIQRISPEARKAYPDLGHSISHDELQYLESWIRSRLKASQEKDG